jgi:hypothetical protein
VLVLPALILRDRCVEAAIAAGATATAGLLLGRGDGHRRLDGFGRLRHLLGGLVYRTNRIGFRILVGVGDRCAHAGRAADRIALRRVAVLAAGLADLLVAGLRLALLGLTRLRFASLALLLAVAVVARLSVTRGVALVARVVATDAVFTLALIARLRLVTLAFITIVLVPRTLFALRSIFTLRAVLAVLVVASLVLTILALTILTGRVLVLAVLLAAILLATSLLGRTLLLAGADRFALVAVIVVAVEIERLLAAWLLLRLRLALFETGAGFAQDAEIMIRELEVIFDVDAVALLLRVACEVLVLLVQLARVAARAAVDAVAGIATTLAAAAALALTATTTAAAIIIVATTATAAGLPVVDQACVLSRRTKIWSCSEMRCKPPSRTDDLDEIGASNLPGPPDCSDLKAKDAGQRSKPTMMSRLRAPARVIASARDLLQAKCEV